MPKKIYFNEEAREKLARGIDTVANVVRMTMGPKGRAVIFNRGVGPMTSLDGVTVAKHVDLRDEAEQDGVEIVKSAARETDKNAGDGTTAATLLVQSLLRRGIQALGLKLDHIGLKAGMDLALSIIQKNIKILAKPVKNESDVSNVATISSRDREVGNCISEMMRKLGKEAVITVEESKMFGLHTEITDGLKIDKGFASPYFVNSQKEAETGEIILEKPYVLVTSQVVSLNNDILNVLNEVLAKEHRVILIISDTIKGEALATAIINRVQHRLSVVAVNAPGFGDDKTDQLKDICALTGATLISEEIGKKVEDAKVEDLGRAERIIVSRESTIIVGGKGKGLKRYLSALRSDIKAEKSEYRKEMKEKRLGKLSGGIGVIHVGTISEEENIEKRYRVEDAVKAAKSAMEEGIVPGAGMTLWYIAEKIKAQADKEKDFAFRAGLKIVEEAIREPARQIISNTGENADVILAKLEQYPVGFGYNSSNGTYVNLLQAGIIDPAKVIRCAVENAVSRVSTLLIAGAVIVEDVEEKDNKGNGEVSN